MSEKQEAKEKAFDLLRNEEFVLWVVNPREESNHYWSKWIAANPQRRKDVEFARSLILSSRKRIVEKMPDKGYDHILEKIFNHGQKSSSHPGGSYRWSNIWKPISIAASVALMMASIYIFSNKQDVVIKEEASATVMIQKEAPIGTKVTTKLPDGSTITLNSSSHITFPKQFTNDSREVSLVGEAFFEVEHNPQKPFIVTMNGDQVRVLGTSFNIRFYPEDSIVNVSVATGRVSYSLPSGKSVILVPDQQATYDLTNGTLVTDQVDRLKAYGWKNNIIYFDRATFKNVLVELERWYGVEIEANGDYHNIGKFSGEFRNETLSQVLNGLSFIYKFEYKIDGTKVTLTKKTKT